jgi:hypothetical protein
MEEVIEILKCMNTKMYADWRDRDHFIPFYKSRWKIPAGGKELVKL